MRLLLSISVARFCGPLLVCLLSMASQSCQVRPPQDPELEWIYAAKISGPEASPKSSGLQKITLDADRAPLGQVLREIAKQADISLIYPKGLETEEYSGKLNGPADTILDAIARRSDNRFTVNNGIGYIGKPLPEDKVIGVFRTWFDDPLAIVAPLLSESGKSSAAGGYCFISDRSEIVYRILSTVGETRPRIYAVQVLEIYTADTFDATATLQNALGPSNGWNPEIGFRAQITASLSDRGAYMGRTWTGIISEGKPFKFMQGQAEQRQTVIVNQSSPVIQNQSFVQTGWHFDVTITGQSAAGEIYQDATDQPVYKIPFQTSAPGLYLLNSATVVQLDRQFGIPESHARSGRFKRNMWLRYHVAGTLLARPPGEDPASGAASERAAPPRLPAPASSPAPAAR